MVRGDLLGPSAAGGLTVVAERHGASDLAEGEADRPGRADERQPLESSVGLAVAGFPHGGASSRPMSSSSRNVLAGTPERRATSPMSMPLDLPVNWNVYARGMDIEIAYVPGCPNLAALRQRLGDALDLTGVTATIRETEVPTIEAAVAAGMAGSPTLLIDGHDPFAGSHAASMSCRLYRVDGSIDGAPAVDEIAAALLGTAVG